MTWISGLGSLRPRSSASTPCAEVEDAEEDGKPLSDSFVRDLTAHRTPGLRLALGEQPDMALLAVTHSHDLFWLRGPKRASSAQGPPSPSGENASAPDSQTTSPDLSSAKYDSPREMFRRLAGTGKHAATIVAAVARE